mmetsp:Transcript_36624/g.81354  ORF Transcript_36624/g.81354 Transcript_36624/m.81354 type:complete len:440 (+) Transcript_36624:1-1320(+)
MFLVYLPTFLFIFTLAHARTPMSIRMARTEPPHIEDVLDAYADLPDLVMLALGSVYWNPPADALQDMVASLSQDSTNKYGSILGEPALRAHLTRKLASHGLHMDALDVVVTAGANQAFANVALALLDPQDDVIILAPYYFSHKMSCALSGAKVHVCKFDEKTVGPDWAALGEMVETVKPKMIVLTTPNNPSGYVWSPPELARLTELCRPHNTWLIADQTYHEFLYDEIHTFPCGKALNYANIVHVFSFSKIFGMPGYRVGYLAYPKELTESMRKLQDTIPTHASILSQQLALRCLERYYPDTPNPDTANLPPAVPISIPSVASPPPAPPAAPSAWVKANVGTLVAARDALWPALSQLGTVRTKGAFYFLVPVPAHVGEAEAVDILARQFGVLLMPGSCFGAPMHMRLSYGSIKPTHLPRAVDRIGRGVVHLLELSNSRG